MNPSKQTDNKLRWSSDVEGVEFKLYIPKDRVPRPWPIRIRVAISEYSAGNPEAASAQGGTEEPIVCVVERVSEKSKTVRYRPLGDPKAWQLGEPYIPLTLLPADLPERLRVEVRWDRTGGTWDE
jgi:hypothetical protein